MRDRVRVCVCVDGELGSCFIQRSARSDTAPAHEIDSIAMRRGNGRESREEEREGNNARERKGQFNLTIYTQ